VVIVYTGGVGGLKFDDDPADRSSPVEVELNDPPTNPELR
jgi:hypothetical protein